MTPEKREVLLLKIRNAIADKEWATACANMETARSGAWTCNWDHDWRESGQRLTEWFAALDAEVKA